MNDTTRPDSTRPEAVDTAAPVRRLRPLRLATVPLALAGTVLFGWQYYAVAYAQPVLWPSAVAAGVFTMYVSLFALSAGLQIVTPWDRGTERLRGELLACLAGAAIGIFIIVLNMALVMPETKAWVALPSAAETVLRRVEHLSILLLMTWLILGLIALLTGDRNRALVFRRPDQRDRKHGLRYWALGGLMLLPPLLAAYIPFVRHVMRATAMERLEERTSELPPEQLATALDKWQLTPHTQLWPGQTLLHLFAARGEPAAVTLLLQRGAPIDQLDNDGLSPLLCALMNHRSRNARLLAEAGARQDILAAAGLGNEGRVAELLADDPARADLLHGTGISPLRFAADFGHAGVAKLLLAAGAGQSGTELRTAAARGHVDVVRLLISAGAESLNAALMQACCSGHADCARVLLEAGAEPNETFQWFSVACDHPETVKLLLDFGMDGSRLSLSSVMKQKDPELMKLLLAAGVEPARARKEARAMGAIDLLDIIDQWELEAEQESRSR